MMLKIVKHVLLDILRSRVVLAYTVFLAAASIGLFNMDADTGKSLASILSMVLMLVPLTSLIFATIHYYNSYEFIELLSAQPLKRGTILLGEYFGVTAALCASFLIGVAVMGIGSWPRPLWLSRALHERLAGRLPENEFQRYADDAVRLAAVDFDVSSAPYLGERAEAEAHRLGWRAL